MAIPGTPGTVYTADGLTHNERGVPSSQAADHLAQLDKRRHKLEHEEQGPPGAPEAQLEAATVGHSPRRR